MSNELISKFHMELEAPGCSPGASWWGVKIYLDDDISEVFPFLNAELNGTDYNHRARVLLWDDDKGFRCAFRPNEIAIAPIENRDTAQEVCDEIIDIVCKTWSRRHEIEPDFTGKAPPPSILQIIKLLPGTNCKDCSYATCMVFAAELMKKQAELSRCPHLPSDAYSQLNDVLNLE